MATTDSHLVSTLPANVEAERSILGAILLDNLSYNQAAEHLKPEDFSLDSHRRIYSRMMDLAESSRPIDMITLIEELDRRKELEPVGDVGYVSGLVDGVPDRPSIEHYVKIVRDKALLRGLIHAANAARDQGQNAVPGDAIAEDLTLFRRGVTVGLSQVRRVPGGRKVKQPPALMLLECLRDRESDVLRFLTDTAIPPTSNQAERDLRPAKTQQKISGRLRSGTATRDRYAVRGYASTARKHGIDVFTAIRDALARNPWIPPVPATA